MVRSLDIVYMLASETCPQPDFALGYPGIGARLSDRPVQCYPDLPVTFESLTRYLKHDSHEQNQEYPLHYG